MRDKYKNRPGEIHSLIRALLALGSFLLDKDIIDGQFQSFLQFYIEIGAVFSTVEKVHRPVVGGDPGDAGLIFGKSHGQLEFFKDALKHAKGKEFLG
jgi:hypothetical protein